MVDYATLYASLYSRAAVDSAGATLRALLGTFPNPFATDTTFNGKAAAFPAEKLSAFAGAGVVLPWLVWRAGSVGGASRDIRDLAASWWVYAAPGAGSRPLHQIAKELETLYGYTNALALSGGRVGITFVGQPRADAALGLTGLEVRIGFRQLG